MFALAQQEPPAEPMITRGIFRVYSSHAIVLLDTGASHSFVAATFAHALGIDVSPLDLFLRVETPVAGFSSLTQVCKGCELRVTDVFDGREFVSTFDLIVLEMRGFDIILGMDWLTSCQAMIDCHQRKVILTTPEESKIRFFTNRCEGQELLLLKDQRK